MGMLRGQLSGRVHLLAAALIAALAVALTLAVSDGVRKADAATGVVTLGATGVAPNPSCPELPCQAVGRTTGYQVTASGAKNLFRVPARGHLVQWSVKLSKPSSTATTPGQPSQLQFFNDFYGKPPKARIAVLRPVGKTKATKSPRFKLMRQSPVEDLTNYMSSTKTATTFVLASPLRVKKGDIVGLTVVTWAPAFAVEIGANNTWRASRSSKKCNGAANIQAGHPQQTLRKVRSYGCLYKSARLLYTAGFIAG
jgi:hypothetical protein